MRRLPSGPIARSLLIVLLMLPGCGMNLMQARRRVDIRVSGGELCHASVWVRPHKGVGTAPAGAVAVGAREHWPAGFFYLAVYAAVEAVDTVLSTGAAGAAVVNPDLRVTVGPLGWVASLLPGITLVPEQVENLPAVMVVYPSEFERISGPDPAVAAEEVKRILASRYGVGVGEAGFDVVTVELGAAATEGNR